MEEYTRADEGHTDFVFKDFVQNIYDTEPLDPFSFRLEFLNNIKETNLRQLLGYFIITGAKILYNKELAQLTSVEIGTLRRYLHSIGWDVSYEIETREEKLNETDPDKTTTVNYYKIDFFPANPALNKHLNNPNLVM